jgi:hypothetical protein
LVIGDARALVRGEGLMGAVFTAGFKLVKFGAVCLRRFQTARGEPSFGASDPRPGSDDSGPVVGACSLRGFFSVSFDMNLCSSCYFTFDDTKYRTT